jgi:hypothetical protein
MVNVSLVDALVYSSPEYVATTWLLLRNTPMQASAAVGRRPGPRL